VTERECIALLDFCTRQFQTDFCFVGKKAKHRIWSGIGFGGFEYDPSRAEWMAEITVQRSDGPVFTLRRWIYMTESIKAADVMSELDAGLKDFDEFLECECGTSLKCYTHPAMEQY